MKPGTPPRRDISVLFSPRSVALVGVSNNPSKWGYHVARGLLKGQHHRDIFFINRRGENVLGKPSFRSLCDLPLAPELVIVTVPAESFEAVVVEALAKGARAIVGITAGLGEMDSTGRLTEERLALRVREADGILVGPNCLGIFDSENELEATGWSDFPHGGIGVISQSGGVINELALFAKEVGLGFSRFVSLGNQADVSATDVMESFIGHSGTRVIVAYIEEFQDGRLFLAAARSAADQGKPLILAAAGRSQAGARAARSHTGAMVGDYAGVSAACRAVPMLHARTPREMIDLAQACLVEHLPKGKRIGVVSDGGGLAVLATDTLGMIGLEVPLLSRSLSSELTSYLPSIGVARNPVDLAGGGEEDPGVFQRIVTTLLFSGEVDAVLLTTYLGGYGRYSDEVQRQEKDAAHRMAIAARESGRPLIVHTMFPFSSAALALREGGVPVYREIETASRILADVEKYSWRKTKAQPILRHIDVKKPARSSDELQCEALSETMYGEGRRLASAAGIPLAAGGRVGTVSGACALAAEIGYPVVLKTLNLVHRSDENGVKLAIENERELRTSFAEFQNHFHAKYYAIESMVADDGIEVLLAVRRDRQFGLLVVVGIGGIYAEILDDVAVALAPIDEKEAKELFLTLRGSRILTGARGRSSVDVAAAARATSALTRVVCADTSIREIEINPLLVKAVGIVALDVKVALEGLAGAEKPGAWKPVDPAREWGSSRSS